MANGGRLLLKKTKYWPQNVSLVGGYKFLREKRVSHKAKCIQLRAVSLRSPIVS